ncbi:MAG: TIM barrel protein [Gemmatimonadetes bacterium]|nr:sugar phosphate isomerase/epimerase [Gemmatimonadota bacterium]NIQ55031.1 sugar phosphate isomerase/epimerase [Gemmatimonadota bacterium]NIU75222.1 TIM barrel protein [Gammaproteobacteria bacterium]NIX45035.1 TIM barrel protein [Gemmatimonadota bacterium]NIY09268.1 TIM barrel protein [Gemmatimonadota bacterium]
MHRREFLLRSAAIAAGAGTLAAIPGCAGAGAAAANAAPGDPDLFDISLAQWSLHRTLFAGDLDPLDFPAVARDRYGLGAVEYVNQFFRDRARDQAWLARLRRSAEEAGVRSLLIMVDGEGALGDPDAGRRAEAVENHRKWLDAASSLGCHSIRVNAASRGTREEQARLAADGLRRLCEHAEPHDLNVLVENHGGLSSDGAWLAGVIERTDHPLAGTLPDFGNFRVSDDPEEWYDRYRGVRELMPYAKAVSAKSHDFDEDGQETRTDYRRMMRIVLDAGYRGYVGIEYEGDELSEHDGIIATRDLLRRVRAELAPAYS